MSTWNHLAATIPPELATAGQAAGQALDTVKTLLDGLRRLVSAGLALATDPASQPVLAAGQAVQALVASVNDALDALLDDVGIYVLPVPLPKRGFVQPLTAGNPDETGSNYLQFPASVVLGGLSDADRQRLAATPLWRQILDSDATFLGGNAYFVRTLAESLSDANDPGRPRFERTDAWAYALVVAGASDVASLGSVAAFIDRSFAARTTGTSRQTVSMVPSNPRADLSGRGRHAVITWDPLAASRVLASYDNSSLVATEVAVIRSSDFRAKTAINVADLFDGATLTAGQTGRYGARVVMLRPYDGVLSRWEDQTDLVAGTTYYYHVAFRGELRPPATAGNATATPVPYGALSRCLEVTPTRRAPAATRGTPPDWIRTPSVASAFPAVEAFLDTVQEQLRSLAQVARTGNDLNNEYVQFLQTEVDRYARRATEIVQYTRAIVSALTVPTAGTAIAYKAGLGTGSSSTFLAAVARDFADESDPNRPAFDTGDEYVVGAVFLAVGPDPTRIHAALDLFTALFGGASESPVVAGINSVTQTVVDVAAQVDAEVRALLPARPDVAFDATMTPAASDPTCGAAGPAAPAGFDASLNPIS